METNRQDDGAVEINLMELVQVLWSKAFTVILVTLVFAVAVYLVESFFVTPQYTSSTKMLVLSRQTEGTLSSSDISTSTSLTQDYVQLIQTRYVTEGAINKLGLTVDGKPMTYRQLLGKMTVEQTTSTRIITISVEDPDPLVAQEIADTLRELAAEHIKNVTDTEAVNVADFANLPAEPSSPHKVRDTAIGGVLGFVIVCAVIITLHLMDNTIKTGEDVERYLNTSLLGAIPMLDSERKKKGLIRRDAK